MLETSQPEALLGSALAAVEDGDGYRAELDKIRVPIYTTDADGWITYWNQACVDFAGREPQLGEDRWCVTWRLFTQEGESLPHDECPMAPWLRQSKKDGR
jgi:PAS domain-containing protein